MPQRSSIALRHVDIFAVCLVIGGQCYAFYGSAGLSYGNRRTRSVKPARILWYQGCIQAPVAINRHIDRACPAFAQAYEKLLVAAGSQPLRASSIVRPRPLRIT